MISQYKYDEAEAHEDRGVHKESMPSWQLPFFLLVWIGSYSSFRQYVCDLGIPECFNYPLLWLVTLILFLFFFFRITVRKVFSRIQSYYRKYRIFLFNYFNFVVFLSFDKKKYNWDLSEKTSDWVIRYKRNNSYAVEIQFLKNYGGLSVKVANQRDGGFDEPKVVHPFQYIWISLLSIRFLTWIVVFSLLRTIKYIFLLFNLRS